MRRLLAIVVFAIAPIVAFACPDRAVPLHERVGQSIVLEGTLHDCKLGPCIETLHDLVILRDTDVTGAFAGFVRIHGVLEHEAGSGSDTCDGQGCDVVASVPAYFFIRAAAIEPKPGLSALVGQEAVVEGRLSVGKRHDVVLVGNEHLDLHEVDRSDLGELVVAEAKVRVKGRIEFSRGTTCANADSSCHDVTGVPPHFFMRHATLEVID